MPLTRSTARRAGVAGNPWNAAGQVRVSTGLLFSNLVNYAGEVSIARARMEQQVYSFRDKLG